MEHARNIDKQNFDELIVAFIGKVLTGKIERENFDESFTFRQIRQTFPPSKFCTIQYTFQNHVPFGCLLNGSINIITLKFCIIAVSLLAFERL